MISGEISLRISITVPASSFCINNGVYPNKSYACIPRSELNVEDTLENLCSY